MIDCLFQKHIILNISSRLNLRGKVTSQCLSQVWKDIALESFRQEKKLVITDEKQFLNDGYECKEHPLSLSKDEIVQEYSIAHKLEDFNFYESLLPKLTNLEVVHLHTYNSDWEDVAFEQYFKIVEILLKTCSDSLLCLKVTDYEGKDVSPFLTVGFLPRLQHLSVHSMTSKEIKEVLSVSPRLVYLNASSAFTDWKCLPPGFKHLESNNDDIEGFASLISSDAVNTIETIKGLNLTSETCFKPYTLKCLKYLRLSVTRDTNSCLYHLARILSNSPVIEELEIYIECNDVMDGETWGKVLSSCPNLKMLDVSYENEQPLDLSTFYDTFADVLSKKLKKLRILIIDFHLPATGLRALACLDHLEELTMYAYVEQLKFESGFYQESLEFFLKTSFSKNLQEVSIRTRKTGEVMQYIVFDESFLGFFRDLEKEHSLKFNLNTKTDFNPNDPTFNREEGKVYMSYIHGSKKT
jgi:hypothetical protein